jgi:ATP-dependent Clp protease adaptor protein ClpS
VTGDDAWQVVVRDDDFNTFCVVSHVLRRVAGLPHELAEQRMLEVHEHGRAVIADFRTREDAELLAAALQVHGLRGAVEAVVL